MSNSTFDTQFWPLQFLHIDLTRAQRLPQPCLQSHVITFSTEAGAGGSVFKTRVLDKKKQPIRRYRRASVASRENFGFMVQITGENAMFCLVAARTGHEFQSLSRPEALDMCPSLP